MKKQDIDHLFKSGLAGYSAQPSLQVWDKIQADVAKSKTKKRLLLFRIAGIAAALVVAIMSAILIFDDKNVQPSLTDNNPIQNTEISNPGKIERKAIQIKSNQSENIEKEKLVVVSNQIDTDFAENTKFAGTEPEPIIDENNDDGNQRSLLNLSLLNLKSGSKVFVQTLQENLRLKNEDNQEVKILESEREIIAMNALTLANNKEFDRWKLGVQLSPGYSSHSASYSDDYSRNMNTSASDGNANVAGGISVEYKTNKKWSVESGIYYSQNGQRSSKSGQLFPTENAQFDAVEDSYYSAIVAVSDGNILLNSTAGVIEIKETPSDAKFYTNLSGAAERMTTLASSGDYYQAFDFVEIPVYVRYKLVESKFNLQIMGGVSTNFLIGNQVYLEEGGISKKVGKTSNISSVSYSGTVGVGVEYSIGKRLSLSIEPRVNYYLSSINKSSEVDYRPYRVGVYTGLNYTF